MMIHDRFNVLIWSSNANAYAYVNKNNYEFCKERMLQQWTTQLDVMFSSITFVAGKISLNDCENLTSEIRSLDTHIILSHRIQPIVILSHVKLNTSLTYCEIVDYLNLIITTNGIPLDEVYKYITVDDYSIICNYNNVITLGHFQDITI